VDSALLNAITSFGLVAAAEMGDKSQLVCMGLAARHRGWPVLLGAVTAFALLNLIAVVFGAGVARWLPDWLVAAAVAVLFTLFAVQSWRAEPEPPGEVAEKPGHSVLASAFLLIFLAEFGDKTQLAVAALSSELSPAGVWAGATVALTVTSMIGVVAGRTVLQRLPIHWLHRLAACSVCPSTGCTAWRRCSSSPWVCSPATAPFSRC